MRALACVPAVVFAPAACNTMARPGRDLEWAGEKIHDKAKK
jgi:predicted small secreted protein